MAKRKRSSAAGAASGKRRASRSEGARTSRKAGPAKASEARAPKKTSGGSRSTRKPKSGPTPGQATKTAAKKAATSKPAAKKTAQGGGSARAKTAAAKRSAETPEAPAYEPPPVIPKTRLTDKQLDEFRQLLLEKRRELVGDVDNLANEALRRSRSEASGDLSSMPIHMADIGSDNWEQEFTLGLIDNEQTLLREIDEALQRIEDRTYGVCLGTHKRIAVGRLRAKPWAKYCIEYARLREQGRAPQG